MGIPSGIGAQLMTAEESTYGTPVTTDRGFEFRAESLSLSEERIESPALRSGQRLLRSSRWFQGQRSVGGDITMELATVSFGRWFKHAFGGVSTSQPDVANAPSVYEHVFSPGDLPKGQTIQVGRPDRGGTVQPFTYHGCKIASWQLQSNVGEIVTFTPTIIGEDEDTSTALATASYPADLDLFTFVNGSLTLSTAQDVRSVSLTGTNGLATDRYKLGSKLRDEPLEQSTEGSQSRTYTGTIEAEFDSLTNYNRFVNGTEATLDLLFEGAIIEDTFKFAVQVTANVRFDGTTPQVPDGNLIMQSLPYKVIDDGTTDISLLYRTTDSTV